MVKKKKQKKYENVLAMVKDLIGKNTEFYRKLKLIIEIKELKDRDALIDERDNSYNPQYPYDTKAAEDLFDNTEKPIGNGLFGRGHK